MSDRRTRALSIASALVLALPTALAQPAAPGSVAPASGAAPVAPASDTASGEKAPDEKSADGEKAADGETAADGEKAANNEKTAAQPAAPVKKPVPTDPRAAEVQAFEAEVERFAAEHAEFKADADRLLKHQYERRQREVKGRYTQVVKDLAEEERKRRGEAILRFEEFVKRYPDNPRYTPDAMFRLAELHFEKSNDTYLLALEQFDKDIAAFDAGKLQDEPQEPKQDYTRTIELFARLIDNWPDYRNVDGAHYLKGYCQFEMGENEAALKEFELLVQRFPKSRFVPETWTRIGEYWFDKNAFPKAIEAYSKVLPFTDSAYYDKALYKLGWTHYLANQYDEAIQRFRQLIEFSDEKVAKTGQAGSELRAEAIQYLAISISDEDWDGDGNPDPDSGVERVAKYITGERPYDVELLRALAELFHDDARHEEAIATMRQLLKQFPDDKGNPELHAKLIVSLERVRRQDEAFRERDKLGQLYGPDSDWFAANQNNPEVLQIAKELIEESLIQAATYHHSLAQRFKAKAEQGDAAAEAKAIEEYGLAASAYEDYLAQYPKSENAYDLGYFYAECLYYSFRFPDAAAQYAKVRDSKLGDKYREISGFSAILARENQVKELIGKGEIEPKPSLTNEPAKKEPAAEGDNPAEASAEKIEVEAEEVPEAVDELLTARKSYAERKLNDAEDPQRLPRIIYKIGEVYFDYKDFESARKWFQKLITAHPKSEVAGFAAGKVMETFRLENDFDKMAEWAQYVQSANLGGNIANELGEIGVGAEFVQASLLFKAKKYDEAAAKYEELIKKHPDKKTVDAAINNLAVAYEFTRRFESATKAYERLYTRFPNSQYAENALFRVGVNSERFYNFDKAIESHLRLVSKYPDSQNRAVSLYNAAELLEQTQSYSRAAKAYERYAKLFPSREDTPKTFFRAARVYKKLGDTTNQLRIYRQFNRQYGGDPKQNVKVIEGLARTAEAVAKQGKTRPTRRAWSQVINEFNRRAMTPGTYEAQFPAKAQFELVEQSFGKYESLKLTGSLRNQGRIVKAMQRQVKDLSRRYTEVLQYKSVEWNLAALYRLGHIYQLFAEKLYEAPIPAGLSADEEDYYRTQLEDIAVPLEDEAVKRYKLALEKGREFKVTNQWTKRIVAALNKFEPSKYPLFKEERRMAVTDQLTPAMIRFVPRGDDDETAPDDDDGAAEGDDESAEADEDAEDDEEEESAAADDDDDEEEDDDESAAIQNDDDEEEG